MDSIDPKKKWVEYHWHEERKEFDDYLPLSDWGIIIDLLQSINQSIDIVLICYSEDSIDRDFHYGEKMTISGGVSNSYPTIFKLLEAEKWDHRRVSIRLLVGSEIEIPSPVLYSIGNELFGSHAYEIEYLDKIPEFANKSGNALLQSVSPADALRFFHPPFGEFYQTGQTSPSLKISSHVNEFPRSGVSLGKANIREIRSDQDVDVKISESDRLRHMYIIGKTGSGKTNLLKHMASQDVQVENRGVTIIDPHGDLVDHVLREIPENRVNDVILIDLSRTESLPILNPLDIDRNDDTVRDRTIQELLGLMSSRVYHQYTGPRFDDLVRNSILTMLDKGYPQSPSIVEIPEFVTDDKFRGAALELIQNDKLRKWWKFHKSLTNSRDYADLAHWVSSKFSDIISDSTLKCVVGGKQSTIRIDDIVKTGRILLVKIPDAVIGTQASDFLGSLILSQLRTAIVRRRILENSENYHFIYIDEFQNFANTDFHSLVAEARKFNIGFTLANQNLEQLREFQPHTGSFNQRLINAIIGNVGNFISFSIGSLDAKFMEEHFSVDANDFLRIGQYEALAKILVNGKETSAFTLSPPEAVKHENPRILSTIEELMKETYWVDAASTLLEISGRVQSVIEFAEKEENKSKSDSNLTDSIPLIDKSENDELIDSTIFPKRLVNLLINSGIHSVKDLSRYKIEELIGISGIGKVYLEMIEQYLNNSSIK